MRLVIYERTGKRTRNGHERTGKRMVNKSILRKEEAGRLTPASLIILYCRVRILIDHLVDTLKLHTIYLSS